MKNIKQNKNEDLYFDRIEGMQMKFKLNKTTNKRYVYIKNLDLISGLNKEMDSYTHDGNWVEIEGKKDCKIKVRYCLITLLKYMITLAKDVLNKRIKEINM